MKKRQVKETRLAQSVPTAKLEALLDTSDQMMRSIFLGDRNATLDTVTRHIHDILSAESSAIYLLHEDSNKLLVLASSFSDKTGTATNSDPTPIKIQSRKGEGLTGHIANKGKIVNMSFTQMQKSAFYAKKTPFHLQSQVCYSLLAIPLKDRKGRLIGLFKAENKKNKSQIPNEETLFETVDMALAGILANKLVIVLENLRAQNVLQNLIQDAQSERSYSLILENILKRASLFMHADRSDLTMWSEQKQDLVIAAVHGETIPGAASPGQPAHSPGLIRSFWENNNKPAIATFKNVTNEAQYFEVNRQTKSEALVRLKLENRDIGVLNLESFYINGFNVQDATSLQLISNYVAIAIQMAAKNNSLRLAPLHAITEMPSDLDADFANDKFLNHIYNVMLAAGFERGRVFTYDQSSGEFNCVGSFDPNSNGDFISHRSGINENPYAKDMKDTFLNNRRARIYDPTDPRFFGEDPSADDFAKPKDLAWAAAPLIVLGELTGQITADNALTRKPITEESLEYLNLIAVHISRCMSQRYTAQLSILMKEHPDFIYFKDRESRFLSISKSLADTFGLDDPKEAVGKSDFTYFNSKDAEEKYQNEQNIIQSGNSNIKSFEEKHHVVYKKEFVCWVSTTKMPLKTADGNTIGTFGISRDITEQRQSQEQLAKANSELLLNQNELLKAKFELDEQLASASKITHFGFWEWNILDDPCGDKITATDEIFRIFNIERKSHYVSLADLGKLIHPDDLDIWSKNFSIEALSTHNVSFFAFQVRLKLTNGNVRNLYAKAEIKRTDAIGRPVLVMGLIQDITDLKTDKKLELGIRGFMHMIPGKAGAASGALNKLGKGINVDYNLGKASHFIFMVQLKCDEVRSLFHNECAFPKYSIGQMIQCAWAIATNLRRIDGHGLNIEYGPTAQADMKVTGAFYTAAVNILTNSRMHGTSPFWVYVFNCGREVEVVFGDGGPKEKFLARDKSIADHGVGLLLVGKVLEIAEGYYEVLTQKRALNLYPQAKRAIEKCNTIYRVVVPA
jgi:PAS domain S-box-containing protein